jgi:uncharacterized protein YkwD
MSLNFWPATIFALMLAAPAPAAAPDLEAQIIAALNFARQHPAEYAQTLVAYRRLYRGQLVMEPNARRLRTDEGVRAVDEAIAFLRAQAPEPPLMADAALRRSASSLVEDQGPGGLMGHYGSSGSLPEDRITAFGAWRGMIAENIAYGPKTAEDVVRGLIIDDGVPDRGHRQNIFDPRLRVAGAACGPHRAYGFMCVIDFATQIRDR